MESKPLILLVDDEKDFLEIFSTKLKAAGFDVAMVSSGSEAISKLKEIKPSLILLDFKMPEMDGVETLSKIRSDEDNKKIKIVFLTSYGEPLPVSNLSENDKKFAQEMGANDYIRKEEDLDEIVKKIKGILEK